MLDDAWGEGLERSSKIYKMASLPSTYGEFWVQVTSGSQKLWYPSHGLGWHCPTSSDVQPGWFHTQKVLTWEPENDSFEKGAPPGFMFWPLRRVNWDYRLLSMYRMLGRVETLVAKLRPGEKAHSGHVTLKTSRRMFAVKPPSKQSPQKVLGFSPSRQGWTQRYKRWAPQSFFKYENIGEHTRKRLDFW